MENYELKTETKILYAAQKIFLLYGYHGTKLHQIATEASVHKSAIHYYFRSKDRLYIKVIGNILHSIAGSELKSKMLHHGFEKQNWFLYTELYNNEYLFDWALKELYPNDWACRLTELKKTLKKN